MSYQTFQYEYHQRKNKDKCEMKSSMTSIQTISDIEALSESIDLECKLAAGKDGKGKLPADFWPTYSAFANTHGGIVLLGIREKKGHFSLNGITEPEQVINVLFNLLNNPQKVSCNLLSDHDVQIIRINDKNIIQIHIPAANRKQKPIYLNGNPLNGNTYRRLHEGDRACSDEDVKRMLAEQVEESRDIRILPGFDLNDLDVESLHAYRNMLASHRPDHPWLSFDDQQFLQVLGCFRKDRRSGEEGLTLAGLLMFGQWTSIQEALPNYFVDYQEQPLDKTSETRWLDRVVPDGTWSGNIFDFFRRISRKLVTDLKVPFVLEGNFRQDDTLRHRALREALVNALVHADYSDRASILVVKDPDGFVFRNPGLMRVPVEQALQGGESDCRNRTLHQLFLMINLGERAGSGLPKIRQGWEEAGGRLNLFDSFEPYDQTRLEMSWGTMLSEQKMMIEDKQDKTSGKRWGNVGKTSGKTLEKRRGNVGEMSGKTSERVINAILENEYITIPELARRIDVTERSIERNIQKLQAENRLRRIGPPKGGRWAVIGDHRRSA